MMRSIWKFPLEITHRQLVRAPRGWRPLSVQKQGGQVCLWAMVDTGAEVREHVVRMSVTGHPADEASVLEFVDTVQTGVLVWHVFAEVGS